MPGFALPVMIVLRWSDTFASEKTAAVQALLARLRKFRGRLPANFTFNRLEANQR